MKHSILLTYLLVLFGLSATGQLGNSGNIIGGEKYAGLYYENDFFTGTDMYYTQGIRVEFVDPVLRYSPVMWLLPVLGHSSVKYGLSAGQDCFTPTSITSPTILYGNEPFAGYIYLGHYKASTDDTKKQMLTAELDAGEIGPCAECEEEQKAIHKAVPGNVQPDGWQYQIRSALLLNYKLRYENALFSDTAIDIDAIGQATAGTVYDNALAGFALHLGKMQSYFSANRNSAFQLYGNFQVWVEGVAYNGTMQGALFAPESVYTLSSKELNHIVLGDSYGICLSYHKILLEYSGTRITNEILTGVNHGWGHIGIVVFF
jgi:lipid A 3-O-deacylase